MNLVEVFVINCLGTLLNKMYLRKSSTSSIQNQIIRLALIRIESVYRLKTEIKDRYALLALPQSCLKKTNIGLN